MKYMKFICSSILVICAFGLFLNWVGISINPDIPKSDAFLHWTGLYILVVVATLLLQLTNYMNHFKPLVNFLLLVSIPLASLYNFYLFKISMNISSVPDIEFSLKNVEPGFYITFISSIIAIPIYLFFVYKNKKMVNRSI
jgi:hypothetical protein